jgi:hypothetical protein
MGRGTDRKRNSRRDRGRNTVKRGIGAGGGTEGDIEDGLNN